MEVWCPTDQQLCGKVRLRAMVQGRDVRDVTSGIAHQVWHSDVSALDYWLEC